MHVVETENHSLSLFGSTSEFDEWRWLLIGPNIYIFLVNLHLSQFVKLEPHKTLIHQKKKKNHTKRFLYRYISKEPHKPLISYIVLKKNLRKISKSRSLSPPIIGNLSCRYSTKEFYQKNIRPKRKNLSCP